MAKELAYINRQDLVDTADALRERLNTTSPYTTSMFAEAVRAIQGGSDTEAETPTISVSNSGLITASANGLSATQQLTTQAAATITPLESAQTAVAAGKYTTGAVTVAAIPSTYIGSGVTVNKYYTGSSDPASSLGNNGDLYLLIPSASSDPDGGEDSPIWEEEPIDEEENLFN